jgi:DNA-3-methyladenine glycosylase
MKQRLTDAFFLRDVLEVAPELPGKLICLPGNRSYGITEVEAYRGEEDLACHARHGLTRRNAIMYAQGGVVYMYFVYGMHWMMNIVCSTKNDPQAVLIRAVEGAGGPGKLTRLLGLDGSYNGVSLVHSGRIWLEDGSIPGKISVTPRIGIDYAPEPWKSMPWRFVASGIKAL